jgi:hypothetical protein
MLRRALFDELGRNSPKNLAQLRVASRNAACTAVSSVLRNRDLSLLVSGAGPRAIVPSSRRCCAISRPASAFPIFASVHCFPVGETTRTPFLRQREASGISEVTHTSVGSDALGNPVIGCIRVLADENHAHVWGSRRPDWSRAIRDNENVEPKTHRNAVDLLAHRARVTVDVKVCQWSARSILDTGFEALRTDSLSPPLPDLDSRTGFRHREWQKCWRLIKPGQKCGAKL